MVRVRVRVRLQPYVIQAATVCNPGGSQGAQGAQAGGGAARVRLVTAGTRRL